MIGEIVFSLRGNTLLAILLVIAAMGGAFAFYRTTLPPLPPRRRWFFSAMRAASLSFVILLFFEPSVRIVHRDEQPPRVAVLIDDSQSMTINDNAVARDSVTRAWLKANGLGRLNSPAAVEYFEFSSKLSAGFPGAPDELKFSGQTTDIANALNQLRDRLTKENIQAAVVVTDGNYTVGKNPLYDAEGIGIPLYTIGVGDTVEQKDVLVEKVVTNNLAYADTRVPVDATIKSSGFSGVNAEVTVSDGTTIVERKVIALQDGTREYPVELFVTPKDEGMKKYTVSVSHLAGELTDKNNTRSFFIKVLKSKMQIVLVAGAPSADVPAVRQGLLDDGHFAVRAFVQKSADEFYENQLSSAALDSADCFVFIGYPTQLSGSTTMRRLREAIEKDKRPLFFINSRTIDYGKLATFDAELPIGWAGISTAEANVFPIVADRYKFHPLLTLEGAMTAEGWQSLPPLFKTQTVFRLKPGAEMLAEAEQQNVALGEPLLAMRNLNGQRSLAITGYGVWQWKLSAQGNAATERFFPAFMSSAVRWLTAKNDEKSVKIAPTQQVFTTAEPAEFTAQVYDEQLHTIDNAEVNVEVRKGDEATQIELHATGNGLYEGSAEGLGEGEYTFSGKAAANGKTYGEDKGTFTVGQVNVEFIETKMNKPLLEQMAFRGGGVYYNIANSGGLADDINKKVKFATKEDVSISEIELWNWQYFLGAIVLLFAVEWLGRKISGMI